MYTIFVQKHLLLNNVAYFFRIFKHLFYIFLLFLALKVFDKNLCLSKFPYHAFSQKPLIYHLNLLSSSLGTECFCTVSVCSTFFNKLWVQLHNEVLKTEVSPYSSIVKKIIPFTWICENNAICMQWSSNSDFCNI